MAFGYLKNFTYNSWFYLTDKLSRICISKTFAHSTKHFPDLRVEIVFYRIICSSSQHLRYFTSLGTIFYISFEYYFLFFLCSIVFFNFLTQMFEIPFSTLFAGSSLKIEMTFHFYRNIVPVFFSIIHNFLLPFCPFIFI